MESLPSRPVPVPGQPGIQDFKRNCAKKQDKTKHLEIIIIIITMITTTIIIKAIILMCGIIHNVKLHFRSSTKKDTED